MTIISRIAEWFRRARPTFSQRSFNVQLGVHFEEVAEMLEALHVDPNMEDCPRDFEGSSIGDLANEARRALSYLGDALKKGDMGDFKVKDRTDFLDAICDQIVTATGCGTQAHMAVDIALEDVNASNWSKFVKGEPVFDENGKIAKGPDYRKPDLTKFI